MNPLSGPALVTLLIRAGESDGLLTMRERRRREQWRAVSAAQDAVALQGLSKSVSLAERWEIISGCCSAWAWHEALSWGRPPNIAIFDGFVDALNTAQSENERARAWDVWPSIVDYALTQENHWLKYLLRALTKVEVWAPGEAVRLNLGCLLPRGDWQAPVLVQAGRSSSARLTPLQYAWHQDRPGLCRVLIDAGADGHAFSPTSWWPGWSLARCIQGQCLGEELARMAGANEEALCALSSVSGTFAHRLSGPEWMELVEYQRPADRRHTLNTTLPFASEALNSGCRF